MVGGSIEGNHVFMVTIVRKTYMFVTTLVGEVLQCDRDPNNAADQYSVTVKKGVVVELLP